MPPEIKLGFVPSYRFRYSPWVQQMRQDSLAAFAQVPGLQIVVPRPNPDGTGRWVGPDGGVRLRG